MLDLFNQIEPTYQACMDSWDPRYQEDLQEKYQEDLYEYMIKLKNIKQKIEILKN